MSSMISSRYQAPDKLEAMMQKVSLAVSLAAVGLMGAGFVGAWGNHSSSPLPGQAALPLSALVPPHGAPASLVAMSAGIVLLALLPMMRVLLALALYVRQRGVLDALAGLVVLLELLMSMQAGG